MKGLCPVYHFLSFYINDLNSDRLLVSVTSQVSRDRRQKFQEHLYLIAISLDVTWFVTSFSVNHSISNRIVLKVVRCFIYEPRHEKPGFLHMPKQRRRSACGNREADQRLCFRYTARFVSDLVGNTEDRFSHNEAQLYHWPEVSLTIKIDKSRARSYAFPTIYHANLRKIIGVDLFSLFFLNRIFQDF